MSTISDANGKCQSCASEQVKIIQMPDDHVHKYKMVCSRCDKYIRWVSDKPTFSDQNSKIISDLLMKPLSQWERSFILSIRQLKRLSPKQSECYERIVIKYRN